MAGRITRKELKTDKFAVEIEHTVDFVTEHRRDLIIYSSIAVGVLLIAIAIFFYTRHQHSVREQALGAAIQFQEAPVGPPNPGTLITFPTEDAKRAAVSKAFGEIASKYSGTSEGAVARYYLGASAADQGKMADAEKFLKEAADKGDKNYSSLARFSLAQVYFAEGKPAEAEKLLRDLIAHPTVFVSKEQATIVLGQGIASTKPAEARKLLEPLRTAPGAVSPIAINAVGVLNGQQ